MNYRRGLAALLLCCLFFVVKALAAQSSSSGKYHSEIEAVRGAGLVNAKLSQQARRQLLDRGREDEDDEDERDDDTDDEEDSDDEDEGGMGGGGTGGGGGTITPSTNCALNVGGTTTNYSKCYSMGAGTTYFTLNGNTLSAGFKVKSLGWGALAIGKPHQGASAVWSTSCGATCAKPSGVTMRSFASSDISAPSRIAFSAMKASKTAAGEHSVSFTMPWPGTATSIQVALANGSGAKNQHAVRPRVYTVNKADLLAAAASSPVVKKQKTKKN